VEGGSMERVAKTRSIVVLSFYALVALVVHQRLLVVYGWRTAV